MPLKISFEPEDVAEQPNHRSVHAFSALLEGVPDDEVTTWAPWLPQEARGAGSTVAGVARVTSELEAAYAMIPERIIRGPRNAGPESDEDAVDWHFNGLTVKADLSITIALLGKHLALLGRRGTFTVGGIT